MHLLERLVFSHFISKAIIFFFWNVELPSLEIYEEKKIIYKEKPYESNGKLNLIRIKINR